jgi:hypothetical protein
VYRAPDDQLSAAEPYKYMVPVFGEGIQYGAPLEIERQQVKFLTHALRPDKMKGYARVIAHEGRGLGRGAGATRASATSTTSSRSSCCARRRTA